jgi:hypothetical protein
MYIVSWTLTFKAIIPNIVLRIISVNTKFIEHSKPLMTQIGMLLGLLSKGFF